VREIFYERLSKIMEIQNLKPENEELKAIFNNSLNTHGYPFQHAVIQAAKEAHEARASHWIFEASEFPVETNGKSTRIDFILKSDDNEHNYFMIAECKRVNPAYGSWCFVKAPIVSRNWSADRFNIESLRRYKYEDPLKVQTHGEAVAQNLYYHVGVAVKNNKTKGDLSGTSDHDAIEKAASQVCLGLNGLIQLAVNVKDLVLFQKSFIPVIFTTASLWTSDCDLSSTDLASGNVDFASSKLEEKPWVLYQYHLSPGIKHSIDSHQSSKELATILDFNYIRTIPIVNANHVGDFLNWLKPHDFFE